MFTLNSPHFLALICALSLVALFNFSFLGLVKSIKEFVILWAVFPFALMALTLFVPQNILHVASYLIVMLGLVKFFIKSPHLWALIKAKIKSMEKNEKQILGFTSLFLLSFFMSATIIRNGGNIQDSMVYHVGGPKEWVLYLNGAKFNPNNPMTFTCSYFDYYYYFLFLLVKPLFVITASLAPTYYEFICYTMLLSAQIFCGIIATVYIPFLLVRVSSKLGLYKYLTIFFILGLRLFTWSWVLPKNDVFPFFCFLIALYLFYTEYLLDQNNKSLSSLFFSALILGIGTGSKLTNAHVVLLALATMGIFYFKTIHTYLKNFPLTKSIAVIVVGLGLGVVVFFLRNYLSTGNPFFPIGKFGFQNIYLSAGAYRPGLYSDPTDWAGAIVKLKLHFYEYPQIFVLLIIAFLMRFRSLSLLYFVSVIFMSKQTGPMYSFRMTNFFLALDLVLFILVFSKLLEHEWFKKYKPLRIIIILAIVILSKVQVEKIVKYPVMEYGKSSGDVIRSAHVNFDNVLNANLSNRENPKYVFAPKEETFLYFSRFVATSLYDSVPEKRIEYFR